MKNFAKSLIAIILVVCMAVSVSGCNALFTDYNTSGGGSASFIQGTPLAENVAFNVNDSTTRTTYSSYATLYNAVYKSVVIIENSTNNGIALGSGVIIDVNVETDSNGRLDNGIYVLTCAHVISNSVSLKIKIANNNFDYTTYSVSGLISSMLIGSDPTTDLAVLRFDLSNVSPAISSTEIVKAKTCDTDAYPILMQEDVLAIGNPSGIEGWSSRGGISKLKLITLVGSVGYMDLLGTDAPLNAGNSGGGLFNMYGELIGVVNAGAEDKDNLGFAIPVSTTGDKDNVMDKGFWNVAYQLIKNRTTDVYGYVEGRIGFDASFSLASNGYMQISGIVPGGELSNQGAQVGDYVTGFTYDGVKNGQNKSGGLADLTNGNTDYAYLNYYSSLYDLNNTFVESDALTITIKVTRITYNGWNQTQQEFTFTITNPPQYIYAP